MKTIKSIFPALLMLCFSFPALCQPPAGPMASPQVNSDKTITFRYLAPSAREVRLSAQFERAPVPMTKDANGIWSVTVGPVKPDIYPYNFQVDGLSVMDPGNVNFFPNERFKASLVEVPGDAPLIHDILDVPHGTVTYEYYPSVEGTTGSLVIYTPPCYRDNPSEQYPVFYLISGTTDTEETFYKVGRVNFIMDNLIARGEARPMIIVMPYGNIEARIAEQRGGLRPADPVGRESDEALMRARSFENDLMNNIIPHVEKNYRVTPNGANRAIGGFSRGGGQTLRTAFGNIESFGYVCCYSAYLSQNEIESNYRYLVDDPGRTNELFRLLWVSVGDEDFLYNQTVEFIEYLKSSGINHKSHISSGGHTWMNVRDYLAETLPMLFR
jgi:enterochelin esterase-like enzyme